METLPYDPLTEEDRYAGEPVLMLHAEGTTLLWAVPPEVILLLKGMLPDEEYRKLLQRTPSLSALTGR